MKFVITSHGSIAAGFAETLKMFFGEMADCHVVSLGNEGIEDFRIKIEQTVELIKTEDVLIFADLIGGTPFNEFAKRGERFQKEFHLLGGTNLGLLIEAMNMKLQEEKGSVIVKRLRQNATIGFYEDLQKMTNEEDE
ncbi:MAG: PTS sugar transporter subunit IIA [Enterococcus avium]